MGELFDVNIPALGKEVYELFLKGRYRLVVVALHALRWIGICLLLAFAATPDHVLFSDGTPADTMSLMRCLATALCICGIFAPVFSSFFARHFAEKR